MNARPTRRVGPSVGARDGAVARVQGRTRYVEDLTADAPGEAPLIGVIVGSPVAKGRIQSIDTVAALEVEGVVRVITSHEAPRMRRVLAASMVEVGQRLPLQDDRVHYRGEVVAVVLAEDRAAAMEGARRVRVRVEAQGDGVFTLADASRRLSEVSRAGIAPGTLDKGDAGALFDTCPVQLDTRYDNAPHHHNCIESSAVIAEWDADGGITVQAAVQWLHIDAMIVAQAFGLDLADRLPGFVARAVTGWAPKSRVRFRNLPSGGAFGRNINPVHLLVACLAAKVAGRAVKVVLTQSQTFSLLAYRGQVSLRLKLGATREGRLRSLQFAADVGKGAFGGFVEPVGEVPFKIYDHEAHSLRTRVADLDLNGTGWMRGPGVSSAMFALESAMDEVAHELDLDPVELRLRNDTPVDPQTGRPWSSKGLRESYALGGERFGWSTRPRGGTVREDGRVVGCGVATAFDLGRQFPATAQVVLVSPTEARVRVAATEIGQGIFTALRTIAAEALGLPREAVHLETSDSSMPYGAGSIGSTGTYSNGSAIVRAVEHLRRRLLRVTRRVPGSSVGRASAADVRLQDGALVGPQGRVSLSDLFEHAPPGGFVGRGVTGTSFGYSRRVARGSFGAVFVQVSVDPLTLSLRVERVVGAYACGRIVEPRIARSQLTGALIWGIGQALCEESRVDPRNGAWVNDEIGEALIPTHADVRQVEAHFVQESDPHNAAGGMKGLGEIGIVGTAAAVANAFFDATGRRVRQTPMAIEHRLAAPVDARWAARRTGGTP